MIIYKATNKINGMSYIGQTIYNLKIRKSKHEWDALNNVGNMYFVRALKKYGIDNFDWNIIAECDDMKELDKLEIYCIDYYDTYNNGYNLTVGGGGCAGYKLTKKIKQKISKANKGCVPWNKNISHTKETRQKISKARKGKHAGKNHYNAKSIILVHPDGGEERFDCIRDVSKKYGLYHGHLTLVAQGKRSHHKGYKCKYV